MGKLRDKLLSEGLDAKDYFKSDNHNVSPFALKSQANGIRLAKSEINQSEDTVKKHCIKYLKDKGWLVVTAYTGGIPIAGGRRATNPMKGHPDCLAFNLKKKQMIYIEWKKSSGGVISQEQLNFQAWLRHCGRTVLVVSSLDNLKEELELHEWQEAG